MRKLMLIFCMGLFSTIAMGQQTGIFKTIVLTDSVKLKNIWYDDLVDSAMVRAMIDSLGACEDIVWGSIVTGGLRDQSDLADTLDKKVTYLTDIAQLQLFVRYGVKLVAVMEPLRGGLFYWTASGTSNTGTVFPAIGGGYWNRLHAGGMMNITFFGATSANSAAANTIIIQAAIAAGYKSLYIPLGVTYNASSITNPQYLGLALYDENVQGYSFGQSASLRESLSTPSHLTLKPQKPQGVTGLWVMGNGSYPFTPDVTGTYNTIKNIFEDADSQILDDSLKNYSDFTITLQENSFNGYGGVRLNTKSNGNFQGDFVPMEFVFQNSSYKAMTIANLQAEVASEGATQFWKFGGRSRAFWYAGRATTAGEYIVVYFRIYKATTTGTTGATIPTHTTGTVSDGGVSWQYLDDVSQAGGGGRHRPTVIFGDYTEAAEPAIGFPTVAAQFAEDAMFLSTTKIRFANGLKTEGNSFISRINQTSNGLTLAADSVHYLSISTSRVTPVGIPFINGISVKTSLATTYNISAVNQCSFADASATNFTAFTGGIAGQALYVTFTTGNTTLVESGSLFLNGNGNITPIADEVYLFIIGTSSQARLVGLSKNGYVQLQSSTPGTVQTGNLNISGKAILANGLTISGGALKLDLASGADATGDMYWRGGSGNINRLPIGTASQTLHVVGGVPVWLDTTAAGASGWGLTGNSGTTAGTNFIGTTDAKDLVFKVNNIITGRLSYLANTANVGFGVLVLNSITSGSSNVAVGYQALKANTSGSANVALGQSSMTLNTTGYDNVAAGRQALYNNLTGIKNIAFGGDALLLNTGSNNIAIGNNSLYNNTSGGNNAGLGNYSGMYSNTASNQIFINGLDRTNYNGDTTLSPIYILQNAAVGLQYITFNGQVKIKDGTQSNGFVLTSDANGLAHWAAPSGGSGITSLNALTGPSQTFTNETNLTIVSTGTAHVLTWAGTLADSRIASAATWNAKIGPSDTAAMLSPYLRSGIAAATYVPYTGATTAVNLGTQNFTTTGLASFASLTNTGTAGNGFVEIVNQSSAPGTPTTAGRIYFDNSNRLSWKGTNGYVRSFDGTANTADRAYVLPDAAGTVALNDNTATFTNKRITKRISTTTSTASLTINADTDDGYTVTALAAGMTINAPSGTPTDGQGLIIRIKDNATARALTWNAAFRIMGTVLPTTTVISKTLYLGCIWNSADSKWDVVSVNQEL